MLDGPYSPRVVPTSITSSSCDNRPTTSATTDTTGLQLTSPVPCGIPWNRLYSFSNTAFRLPENHEAHSSSYHLDKKREASLRGHHRPTPSATAASSLLYRPSYFSATYSPPPSPPAPTGAPATVSAYSSAVSHHYHADEITPASHYAEVGVSASTLTTSAALSNRYQQLAAEHRYGSALPAPSSFSNASGTSRNAKGSFVRAASGLTKANSALQEVRRSASNHNDIHNQAGATQLCSGRGQRHTPSSDNDAGDVDMSDGESLRTSRSKNSNQSLKESTTAASKQAQPSSANATSTAVPDAAAVPNKGRLRSCGSASGQSGDDRLRTATSPQQRPTRLSAAPRRPRSAGPVAGATTAPHSSPRTAQWAMKLIDELVAQVAMQQVSSTTGHSILPSSRFYANLERQRNGASAGAGGAPAGLDRKSYTSPTVADLTTSFLSSRYGSLQWRPMLQEFAVCLHRYHHLSPTCAIFRAYFIHVDAGTLRDFHSFCRLFAAADIPHCSAVQVRREALGNGAHTIVARRYIEVREVVDVLQRMLQNVLWTDSAPYVVVGDELGDASQHHRNVSNGRRYRQSGNGGRDEGQHRYGHGPAARIATVPRLRRLTVDEVRSVKRAVVAWMEDSIEAERELMEVLDGEETSGGNGVGDAATLRHVAFDRPGQVDAYALLQSTLEAMKTLCSFAPPLPRSSAGLPGANGLDTGEDEATGGTEIASGGDAVGGPPAKVARNRREKPRQRHASKPTPSHLRQPPSWHSTVYSSHSPLVRQILASSPRAYAYPAEEHHKSSPVSPDSAWRGRKTPSPSRHSPVREVHRSQRRATSDGDYYEEDSPSEGRAVGSYDRADGNRCSRNERHGDSEPPYRQPRPASAIAVRCSPDGRLWSPPRDSVVVSHGGKRMVTQRRHSIRDEVQQSSRRQSSGTCRAPPCRHSSAPPARAAPSPRLSSCDAAQENRQQGGERHVRVYPQRGEGSEEERDCEHDDYIPSRHSPPSQGRFSSRDRPSPQSPTLNSSGSRNAEPSQHRFPLTYVVNLHAEQRWKEMQRQVAAAERRDACWRHHPRILARLQQQQHQHCSSGKRVGDPVWTTAAAAPTMSSYADVSAVNATLSDIDEELRRRERSHALQQATPYNDQRDAQQQLLHPSLPSSSPWCTQDAIYLRNPQEAAVLATQQACLPLPPEPPQTAIKMVVAAQEESSAHPPRIYPKQESGQLQQDAVVGPVRIAAAVPSGASSQIRIEQVTPPATVAPLATTARIAFQSLKDAPVAAKAAAATTAAAPSPFPSAGLRFTADPALSKDTVLLTDKEQAMLDQLEVALHRLDMQHRRDRAAAASAAVTLTDVDEAGN
ncbi:hypothetical protein ABL78_2577 [Leptomonas seymouri]|uniref:Uncharacterized protein n=1 Tax=Leptomonas seymouri TaxID=5684 RepID=A0A0N1HZ34_LEPSE|nr:hypothetical protein ABL78_2577 [Leptomonas seymouri]|eukprot:KPI88338.1 hypothetical protein ABL78_2577 [Leptomonas seymouri]